VRFVRLDAKLFGPLKERSLELDSDLVLVYGRNESGKSSFRDALETIFYGFKPASRDQHPLACFDPDQVETLHLEADLQFDTGDLQRVERVLQPSGGGLRFAESGAAFSGKRLGNGPLSSEDWPRRETYRDVYSLELLQLDAFRSSVQDDIDQLLLPEMGELPLRPLAEVSAELEREHSELWRNSKRGKPRARELQEQLNGIRSQVAAAKEAEHGLREARTERSRRDLNLEVLQERKNVLDREAIEAPILKELFEFNRRKHEHGSPVDLSALGDLPLVAPGDLAEEIADLEEKLRAPRTRLDQPEPELDEAIESVLSLAPEINRAIDEVHAWSADVGSRAEQQATAAECRESARDNLRGLLESPPSEDDEIAAAAIPLKRLSVAADDWAEASEKHASSIESGPNASASSWRGIAAAGVAGFVTLLVGAIGFADIRLTLLGVVVSAAAFVMALRKKPATALAPPVPPDLDHFFGEFPIAADLRASPVALSRFVTALRGIQGYLNRSREADRKAATIAGSIEARERDWMALCARLGVDTTGSGDLWVARLKASLASASEQSEAVRADREQRAQAKRDCERDAPLLARKTEHQQRLGAALHGAEPGAENLEEAYQRVQARQKEHEFLREREAELKKGPRFSEFENDPRVVALQLPEDAPWRPEHSEERETKRVELEEEIRDERGRLGELKELLGSDKGSALARAKEVQDEVKAELLAVERQRDRLALLESILLRAEREYRDEHQPDVLRRASAYLERVTEGRYRSIDFREGPDHPFWVTSAELSEPIAADAPLSRGTLDQIYLCLRLGVLDHLDEERERFPLVLDDALLRMDGPRRRKVYDLLGEIAPQRQVFVLTCHSTLADELSAGWKVQRIDL
jgi:uncharacterized protein YhaN